MLSNINGNPRGKSSQCLLAGIDTSSYKHAMIPARGPQTCEEVARWGRVETARSCRQGLPFLSFPRSDLVSSYKHAKTTYPKGAGFPTIAFVF